MDPKNDTKTRAIDLGRHYLQTLGFNGFSFQKIADELGIKKASLHYYFASKEDMGLALLKDYEEAYERWTTKVSPLSAEKKLEQMLNVFCKMGLDHKKICPAGVLCADFNTLPNNMKKRLIEFHHIQRQWMIDTLKQGVQEKSLRKDLSIEATADLFLTSIQGGLQVARLRGDMESFKKMIRLLIKNIST
ncbi:TetR/AcrR family transcriptional regulator [Bdellovibrio sp. HCB-162]|uniref:TetR/AcrR family transcriptional regulator n=1 Tax=Bdellovibrio sp. HCB-162 TaxID=3394234 RepID=UPI0039BC28D1